MDHLDPPGGVDRGSVVSARAVVAALGSPGDLDGDGADDLLIGAEFADTVHGFDTGKAYLVLGAP